MAGPKVAKIASKNSPSQRLRAKKIMLDGQEIVPIVYIDSLNRKSLVGAYKESLVGAKGSDLFVKNANNDMMLWHEAAKKANS